MPGHPSRAHRGFLQEEPAGLALLSGSWGPELHGPNGSNPWLLKPTIYGALCLVL